jgi:hypothetical protein
MNEDFLEIFKSLEQSKQKSLLDNLLSNLQLSGMASDINNQNQSGYGYQGRVGYNFPLDNANLTAGITGMGVNLDTPMGNVRENKVMGGDLSYSYGPNTMSLMYDKVGMLPSQMTMPVVGEMPMEDYLRLVYRRAF